MRNLKTDGDQTEIRSSKFPSEIQLRYHLCQLAVSLFLKVYVTTPLEGLTHSARF